MRFFCSRSQDLFKRTIDNVSFRAILGLGSWARFSVKRQNVIFICIMKCKQTVYHQNKVEKIRIQTDCSNFFSFVYLNDRIFVFSKHNLTGIIILI